MSEVKLQQQYESAHSLYLREQLEDSKKIFEALLLNQFRTSDCAYYLGLINSRTGKLIVAKKYLEIAWKAKDDSECIWKELTNINLKLLQIEDAKALLIQAKEKKFTLSLVQECINKLKGLHTDDVALEVNINDLASDLLDIGDLAFIKNTVVGLEHEYGEIPSIMSLKFEHSLQTKDHQSARHILNKQVFRNEVRAQLEIKLAISENNVSAAMELSSNLLKRNPQDTFAHVTKCKILIFTNRLLEAAKILESLTETDCDDDEVAYTTALFHVMSKNYSEAINFFIKFSEKRPLHIKSLLMRGDCLIKLERYAEALNVHKEILSLGHSSSDILSNTALCFMKTGEPAIGLNLIEKAIQLGPKSILLYFRKGLICLLLEKYSLAEQAFNECLQFDKTFGPAYTNLSIALLRNNKLEQAKATCEYALQEINLEEDKVLVLNTLGNTLENMHKYSEAWLEYEKALEIKPNYPPVLTNMGNLLLAQNKKDQASEYYRRVLQLNNNAAEVHHYLSKTQNYRLDDAHLQQMKSLLEKGVDRNSEVFLCYGIAKACEQLQLVDDTYAFLSRGGEVKHALIGYNIENDAELFDKIVNFTRKKDFSRLSTASETVPVFIVGMPRSGTTLVEQILNCHGQIYGAGELIHCNRFFSPIIKENAEGDYEEFASSYLSYIEKISNASPFVVDKMPHNFRYVAMLSKIFPQAKFIHVKRNPRAVCWSNYKTLFTGNNIAYSYKLEDTLEYYKLYNSLMTEWANYVEIFEVNYDELVIRPEVSIRALLDYLGVEFEERCLKPELTNSVVKTASQAQVRQGIYAGSSNEWLKYEGLLPQFFKDFSV